MGKKKRRKIMGKRAQESGSHFKTLVALVLGIIVILVVLYAAYNYKDVLKNFIPGFQTVNDTITPPTEDHIPKEEQGLYTKKYPTIMVVYDDEGDNHAFTFRWNSNINKPAGAPQVVMDIDEGQEGQRDTIWRTDPRSFPVYSTSEVYPNERANIKRIMRSKTEEEMFREIADLVTRDDDYYAFFPSSNYNVVRPLKSTLQKVSGTEIQETLYCIIKEVRIREVDTDTRSYLSDSIASAPSFILRKKYEMTITGSDKCSGTISRFTISNLDTSLQNIAGTITGTYVKLQDPFNIMVQSYGIEKAPGIYKTSFQCISGCDFYSPPVQGFKERTFYFKLVK